MSICRYKGVEINKIRCLPSIIYLKKGILICNGAENVRLGCKLKVNENKIKTQFISILLLCNVSMQ